jgi:hypothetical protein
MKPRRLLLGLGPLLGIFALIQVIPYGRTHANPPTTREPAWDSLRTRDLAVRACFDCHSNQTRWPGYADVAPLSWVVQDDVESGRSVINFSSWDQRFALAESSSTSVLTGNMPPTWYRMAHPDADLSDAERTELANGLDATLRVR